jgi:RNA recognition motif-containing protein
MNIYVSNLSFNITDADLRQTFETYGAVTSAKIVMDKMTQRSRGFGFVEMFSTEEANSAINQLNGSTLDSRTINVNEAKPREERSPRTFSSNRW